MYRDEILPLARLAVAASRSGYESGKNSFAELIAAERTLRDAEAESLMHLTEYQTAAAELAASRRRGFSRFARYQMMSHPHFKKSLDRRRFLGLAGGAALSVLIGTAGCSKPGLSLSNTGDASVDHYTCTMHPSVHLRDPKDKCPICGMNVVPVFKRGTPDTD